MSEQATMSEVTSAACSIIDKYDEQQIIAIDFEVMKKLVYEVNGGQRLAYSGVKRLLLKMANKGNPLGFKEYPQITLVKLDESDRNTWIWYAVVHMYSKKTRLESYGLSESAYIEIIYNKQTDAWIPNGYDKLGRTKAVSKAARDAAMQLIPEVEIERLLKAASKEQIMDDPR